MSERSVSPDAVLLALRVQGAGIAADLATETGESLTAVTATLERAREAGVARTRGGAGGSWVLTGAGRRQVDDRLGPLRLGRCSTRLEKPSDDLEEVRQLDGFRLVGVAARFQCLLPVGAHGVGRESDDRNPARAIAGDRFTPSCASACNKEGFQAAKRSFNPRGGSCER